MSDSVSSRRSDSPRRSGLPRSSRGRSPAGQPVSGKNGRGHRAIFFGYIALGLLLAVVSVRRGMIELEARLVAHPRYTFHAAELHLAAAPAWADDTILRAARTAASRLDGRSILEPSFGCDLRSALGRVPWIASVRETRFGQGRCDVRVEYRVPVAWLPAESVATTKPHAEGRAPSALASSAGLYVASDGALLPYAGRPLRLPGLRSRRGELTQRELRVAAREIADLSRVFRLGSSNGARDPRSRIAAALREAGALRVDSARRIWRSWLGVEIVREVRGDGRANALLDLVFRGEAAEGSQHCRIRWGRGRLDARPGDLSFDRKVSHLARVHYHHPGWRDVSRGIVSFFEPVVYLRDEEAPPPDGAFAAAVGP